jgi:hypothetical protein
MAQSTVSPLTPPPPARSPGRPKGRLNNATVEIRAFFRAFFESPRYRENLQKRILAGEAKHMETLGHYYAYGRPKQPYQVEVSPPRIPMRELMTNMSSDEIKLLADVARAFRNKARAMANDEVARLAPPATTT